MKNQISALLDFTKCDNVELNEEESKIKKFIKSKQTEQFGAILGLGPDEFKKIVLKIQTEDNKDKVDN